MDTKIFLSRLKNVRKSGAGWTAKCPGHDDKRNSLSIGEGQTGILIKCFTGCGPENITDALGLELRDLFFDSGDNGKGHHTPTFKASVQSITSNGTRQPITVEGLAKDKALPKTFLRDVFKLRDDARGVIIPYLNPDGSTFRDRFRTALKAKDGSSWLAGEGQIAYGLHLLDKARATGVIVIVEGESDVWTLQHHGYPALGIPGASSVNVIEPEHLNGITKIYFVREPDKGGGTFAAKIPARLAALGFTGEICEVKMPDGVKDANDLHKRNPDGFKTSFERCLKDAVIVNQANASTGNDWPAPIPLDAVKLPELTGDIFTGWFDGMIEGVSRSTETPRELATGFALAVLGVATQGKFCVMPEAGYIEPLSIWTVTALESGNRKTSVMQTMTRPLSDWERKKADELKPEISRLVSEFETQKSRIQNLRTKASKLESDDFLIAQREIAELETELPVIPVAPRLWVQDVTPEKLGVVMAEQNERIGLFSDEGGIFDTLAGRYSGGIPNLDLFLQSHAGSPVRVDRQGREPVFMNNPALSIGLSPQPEVLRRLAENSSFRGRGLLARFLYFLPTSPLGSRTLESRPLPESVKAEYDRAIRRLLNIQPAIGDDGRPRPHVLKFSPEAYADWKEMAHYVERNLRDGGQFEHIKDWAGKLPGACARLAGLLHVAEHVFDDPWAHEISAATMNRALSFGVVFSQHAQAIFDLIGTDESLDAARRVWCWIERTRPKTFTARDAFHSLQRTFHNMEAMEPGFAVLIERLFIRELEGERRPGRPSRKFIVNPRIVEGWQ